MTLKATIIRRLQVAAVLWIVAAVWGAAAAIQHHYFRTLEEQELVWVEPLAP